MTDHPVRDSRVLLRQEGTGQLVDIPLTPRPQTSLALHKIEHLALLMNHYGKPVTEKGFGTGQGGGTQRPAALLGPKSA